MNVSVIPTPHHVLLITQLINSCQATACLNTQTHTHTHTHTLVRGSHGTVLIKQTDASSSMMSLLVVICWPRLTSLALVYINHRFPLLNFFSNAQNYCERESLRCTCDDLQRRNKKSLLREPDRWRNRLWNFSASRQHKLLLYVSTVSCKSVLSAE